MAVLVRCVVVLFDALYMIVHPILLNITSFTFLLYYGLVLFVTITQQAYCEMKKFGGGWTRIANIKPREQKKCPGQMTYSSFNQGVCQLASSHHGTRRGATFSSKGITYTSVMGYVHGYQVKSVMVTFYTKLLLMY